MKSNPLRNIQRHDHNYFHGWVASVSRHGRRRQKYFSDAEEGPPGSLARALEWRDDVERHLPPPVKLKRTLRIKKDGIIGVTRAVERTPAGTVMERWVAEWPVLVAGERRRAKRSFSVNRYGEDGARQKAIAARRKGVDEYIATRAREFHQPRRLKRG